MQRISYLRPESKEVACEYLSEHGEEAVILSGGQSLIQLLKQRLISAKIVIDISDIDELKTISKTDDQLEIGAGTVYNEVATHPSVVNNVPVLTEVIHKIGDTQIRNLGTFGGGIAHADPQGDPPVIATALGAKMRLESKGNTRILSPNEFFDGYFETALKPNELLSMVKVPIPSNDTFTKYCTYAPRAGDYAIATVAIVLEFDEREISCANITIGSVVDPPKVASLVNDFLEGKRLSEEIKQEAVEKILEDVDPFDDHMGSSAYKSSLLQTLLSRGLDDAVQALSSS